MDNGSWTKYGVRIATNCFTKKEVEVLVIILKNKYNLNCTIQYLKSINKYSIYIINSSIPALKFIVLPYMHKSMYYKLGI